MDTLTLAKYILPVEIVDNFEIVEIKIKGEALIIKLDEKLTRKIHRKTIEVNIKHY